MIAASRLARLNFFSSVRSNTFNYLWVWLLSVTRIFSCVRAKRSTVQRLNVRMAAQVQTHCEEERQEEGPVSEAEREEV